MGTYIYEWKAAYAINVLKGKHKKNEEDSFEASKSNLFNDRWNSSHCTSTCCSVISGEH